MLSSSNQNNESAQYFHQGLNSVNHWWVINYVAYKTLATLFLILRSCSGFPNKIQHNNFYRQSFQCVLHSIKGLFSAASGSSPNKSINVDCRADVFLLPARCAASYFKRYVQ